MSPSTASTSASSSPGRTTRSGTPPRSPGTRRRRPSTPPTPCACPSPKRDAPTSTGPVPTCWGPSPTPCSRRRPPNSSTSASAPSPGNPCCAGCSPLLARDEARHFGLYSQLVEAYVRRDPKAAAPHLKDVLRTFRMPLAETLPRYRRWSLDVADHCGYDHTEAYGALERLLRRYTDSRGGDGVDDLATFVTSLRALP
ncbi:acyl-ACP desaturase [Streptomyces clavuligerus]|uniref:acyl-ACP desaturase n=1 Tax=Streptomyces clavuligerus TaxID=1901 RepID=UPI001F074D72|nr:acyl-ACP desaturase [Streptomyces clavuligerus]